MVFSEQNVSRDTLGQFSEKVGSRPEVSLTEWDALPEADVKTRVAPKHTSEENRELFIQREALVHELRAIEWIDGTHPVGLTSLYTHRKSVLDFDSQHPDIAGLGVRVVEPTPDIVAVPGRDSDGKKVWAAPGPDGMDLAARRSGLRKFAVTYGVKPKKWTWEGRTPEEALSAAYAGVQTDEVRENRIDSLGYSPSEVSSSLRSAADLRFKMGQITQTERDAAFN